MEKRYIIFDLTIEDIVKEDGKNKEFSSWAEATRWALSNLNKHMVIELI